MQLLNLKFERRGGELYIITPIWEKVDVRPSASGRSWVLASTEGPFDLRQLDKTVRVPVMVEVNIYIPRGADDESLRVKL